MLSARRISNWNASIARSKRYLLKDGSVIYRKVDIDLLKDGHFIANLRWQRDGHALLMGTLLRKAYAGRSERTRFGF